MSDVEALPSRNPGEPVFVIPCDSYEKDLLTGKIGEAMQAIGLTPLMLNGKRIAVKPNLVIRKDPSIAATTNPVFLDAFLTWLESFCEPKDLILAESSGGPYTEASLRAVYRECGIQRAVETHSIRLNYDVSSKSVSAPSGKACRQFDLITPIEEADVIFNLSKLKSHSLTRMSGAVKNTFGCIPGLTKFEYHARFPKNDLFQTMLVDLSDLLHSSRTVIDLQDAIIGMEGNGPTAGTPRKIGVVLCSRNPFCLDRIAEAILGCPGETGMLKEASERGFCPERADEVVSFGADWHQYVLSDFKAPDSRVSLSSALSWLPNLFGGKVYAWFEPRPVIRKKTCVGCGDCARSCPVHTITMVPDRKGKRHARINPDSCIRCFCCQELCPFRSIDIRKNPVLKGLAALRR